MATHSSILAWKIPCMEEPGGLQSMVLTYLGTALTGSDCYECKTCGPIDKMREES